MQQTQKILRIRSELLARMPRQAGDKPATSQLFRPISIIEISVLS